MTIRKGTGKLNTRGSSAIRFKSYCLPTKLLTVLHTLVATARDITQSSASLSCKQGQAECQYPRLPFLE